MERGSVSCRARSRWPATSCVILRETGELVLADASPQAFRPIARAQILPPTLRAHPALADGFLYVRNSDTSNHDTARLLRPSP